MKHWFLPTEKNNHKAHLLKPMGLSLLFGLYLLNQYFLKTLAYIKPGVLGYSSEITAQKVLEQTNRYREKNNLSELKLNSNLNQSAQAKANNMFSLGYWAHNAPDGTTPWSFFKQAGYSYSFAGENLAKDFYDTDSLMTAWVNSPTHRANLINDKYQEIGIGVVNGTLNGYQTTLVVQHFGTPLTALVSSRPKQSKPIVSPEVVVNAAEPAKEVLPVLQTNSTKVLAATRPINPFLVSKTVGSLIFTLLVGLMFIDAYVVLKNNTHRLSGSSLAHMGFLLVMFAALLMARQGVLV